MAKRRVKTESIENLRRVIDNKEDNVEIVGQTDIVTADAYAESVAVDEHLEEVDKELQKKAEEVTEGKTDSSNTNTETKEVKNIFTAKLVLDESITDVSFLREDGKIDGRQFRSSEEDDKDIYLDYDMFDFLYALFRGYIDGNSYKHPKNPLDHPIRTFRSSAQDSYMNDEGMAGVEQISVGSDLKSIKLSANNEEDFKDAIDICNLYKIKYTKPEFKRSKFTHWNYTMTVYVPMAGDGYPMLLADYMETIGKTVEDVMSPAYAKTYRKKVAGIEKEKDAMMIEKEVRHMVNKAITVAANDGEPLKNHLKNLFTDLKAAGLKFNRASVTNQFMSAFEDEPDNE